MKKAVAAALVTMAIAAVCGPVRAGEEMDPGRLVANPRDYLGKTVTITVRFGKINNVFRGWEGEANLKASSKIKFIAMPLAEIACYADKNDENEKLLGGIRPGQEMTLTGYMRKYKMEAKIKGERHTVKRTVKGSEIYGFMVKKIDEVGEAAPGGPGGPGGMMPRGRRMMLR